MPLILTYKGKQYSLPRNKVTILNCAEERMRTDIRIRDTGDSSGDVRGIVSVSIREVVNG